MHLSIGSLGEGCQVYFGKALYVANPQGNDQERDSRHQSGRSWTLEKKTSGFEHRLCMIDNSHIWRVVEIV